jgi:hypothetical protein
LKRGSWEAGKKGKRIKVKGERKKDRKQAKRINQINPVKKILEMNGFHLIAKKN